MLAPPFEFYAYLGAFFLASFLAVYMAKRPEQPSVTGEDDDMPLANEEFRQDVLPMFEDKNADLVKRLREVARKVARERGGGITSADVIAALQREDPAMYRCLETAERRIMGAVFVSGWVQTGEWRPTGSRGRPQRVWVLKEAA